MSVFSKLDRLDSHRCWWLWMDSGGSFPSKKYNPRRTARCLETGFFTLGAGCKEVHS
ncbi:hypothetical protein QUB16_00560 [Microcoleus sp. D3_18a_C4]